MQDYIEECNVDLKALNGIVETISAARNDHKTCCSDLKMITRKIEELELEINSYVSKGEISGNKCPPKNWAVEVTEQKNFVVSRSAQENEK